MFLIIIGVSLVYRVFFKGIIFDSIDNHIEDSSVPVESAMTVQTSESTYITINNPTSIRVYICGEVVNPGVYEIEKGSLLCDIIDIAGGLSEYAPIEHINMVYEITENISIYIPSVSEIENIEYAGQFDESIIRIWGNPEDNVSESQTAEPDSSTSEQNLININTASKEELMNLPGIGDKLAQAILDYRVGNTFQSIDDVKNVPGIGDSKFQKFEDFICVN